MTAHPDTRNPQHVAFSPSPRDGYPFAGGVPPKHAKELIDVGETTVWGRVAASG